MEQKRFLLGYRHPNVSLYKPKINRLKQAALFVAFIPFLLTIGTNWLYFVGLSFLFKLNPLFLYK